MRIGELSARSGIAASRIRFYERIGLLRTVERRPNGYRIYPPMALVALEVITTAQAAGFSLGEIRTLLPTEIERWDHEALMKTLRGKIDEIVQLQTRLSATKARLEAAVEEIDARPEGIDCEANARRVIAGLLTGDEDPGLPSPALRAGRPRP